MLRAFKTEISPSTVQKKKIDKTIGICRFVYNFYVAHNKEIYEKEHRFVSGMEFSKWLNNEFLLNNQEFSWIKEVSSKAVKQAIMHGDKAFKRFFKGMSKFPRFKKKKNQDVKAYFPKNNKTDWEVNRHRIKIPTLGWVKLKEFGYIPLNAKLTSGTVSQKGDRYYVSVLVEVEEKKSHNTSTEGIGIDLGIKDFAICSNGEVFKNLNKSSTIRKVEKKLKREQRYLSRKYENRKKVKTATNRGRNIDKNLLRVQKLHQRLTNMRNEYHAYVVSMMTKNKPEYITIEDLNIKGMMKNRHLSKSIGSQGFYNFKLKLTSACRKIGIELRQVSRFYPSSKICSCCGKKKVSLSLSDRVFECESCGLTIDRDLNASINLMQAKEYVILT